MLEQLRSAGCAMSIVTNKPTHATTLILPALGIRNYFGEIVCRDSATPPFTSKAQMLIDLLERQAILADETLMVGDTLEDCHAAAAAGIACALVPHGYGHPIEGDLPAGCLRIAGWDDLVAICSGSVFTKVNVALSGVIKG
jgi:phosphoglycolate phosphatase